jgi:dTDP-glucose pyrophosphorylase
MGWIDAEQLARLAKPLEKTEYGQYLQALADGLDI